MNKRATGPVRPDHDYMYKLTSAILGQRIILAGLLLLSLALAGVVVLALQRPRLITAVDFQTGRTVSAVGREQLTRDILDKQLVYYSRVFCESFFSQNHVTIKSDRMKVLDLIHPELRGRLPDNFADDDAVANVLRRKATSFYNWQIKPTITERDDPRYSVFCQFTRVVKRPGYRKLEQTFNIKLDWGRLIKNTDPFTRPHNLVLLSFSELEKDSKELINQLNLIR